MTDNVVEVVISGRDDSGAAYTSAAAKEKAFADLTAKNSQQFQRQWDNNRRAVLRGHDALLMAARAEQDIDREARKLRAIEQEMSGGNGRGLIGRMLFGNSGGGWGSGGLSGMLTGGENGGGNILTSIGGSGGGLGWVGLAGAAAALVAELDALASGFAAAGAGAGAFFALSHNAFSQLQSDAGKLQSGQVAVQLAQNMEKLYPSPAHLKALDAAREKLKALTMSMGQDAGPAAQAMQQMGDTWHKLQAQFAPTAFKVLGDGFKTIAAFMPALIPLAKAFAGALDPLLKQLGKFAQSQGFQDWLKKFTALVGPATSAIGHGLANVVTNIGKLFTIMSAKDVVNGINIAFRILSGTLTLLGGIIKQTMITWDATTAAFRAVVHAVDNVIHAFDNVRHFIAVAVRDIWHIITTILSPAKLSSFLVNSGRAIIDGLLAGIKSAVGGLYSWVGSIAHGISNVFSSVLHIFSPSKVFEEHGRNLVRGLVNGIRGEAPRAIAAMRNLGVAGLPGGVGGGLRAGGAPIVIQFAPGAGSSGLNALFWQWLKNEVRVNGGGGPGSVQRALGQTA